MEKKFTVPKNEEEFKKMAEPISIEGAQAVLHSLVTKKHQLVKPLDDEINFYVKVIKYKETQSE